MKIHTFDFTFVVCLPVVLMALASAAFAQGSSEQPGAPAPYAREELAQMLAPIALYPDTLLAQILMASTYPLEVVLADRWIEKHPDLKGDSLDAALRDQPWDVSVKSMTHFPDILAEMSARIDETARLGDAFLAQESDVMGMVQELRTQARARGNLKSTPEQKVVVRENAIVVEPNRPEVVYVPVYDPVVAYGPWWYPAYPPYRPYYPYYLGGGIVSFSAGFYVGSAVGSWCWFGWPHHWIGVDFHRASKFHRYGGIHRGGYYPVWRHHPYHRKGFAYRDHRPGRYYGRPLPRSSKARQVVAAGHDRAGRSRIAGDPIRGDVYRRSGGQRRQGPSDRKGFGSSRPHAPVVQDRSGANRPRTAVNWRSQGSGFEHPQTSFRSVTGRGEGRGFGGTASRGFSWGAAQRGQFGRGGSGGRWSR